MGTGGRNSARPEMFVGNATDSAKGGANSTVQPEPSGSDWLWTANTSAGPTMYTDERVTILPEIRGLMTDAGLEAGPEK